LERYQAVLKYQVDPLTPAVVAGKNGYQKQVLECIDWAMQVYSRDRPQSARELQDALMGRGSFGRQSTTGQPAVFNRPSVSRVKVSAQAAKAMNEKDRSSTAVGWMAAALMVASLAVAGTLYWSDLKVHWEGADHSARNSNQPSSISATSTEQPAEAKLPTRHTTRSISKTPTVLWLTAVIPPCSTLTGHQDLQSVALPMENGSRSGYHKLSSSGDVHRFTAQFAARVMPLMPYISATSTWLASASDDGQ
jgi:hypothetical protein